MRYRYERRWMQTALAVAACVPVLAGGAGMIAGSTMLANTTAISLDSHVRYLSGVLFAMGLSFWAIIPRIETHTVPIRLLTFLVVIGGATRLASAIVVEVPSRPMIFAIEMELIVTPLLCWWQSRLARLHTIS